MDKLSKNEKLVMIVFHTLAAIAFGFHLGQLFLIHGQNYSKGGGVFPGLVLLLEFPVLYLVMKFSRRK